MGLAGALTDLQALTERLRRDCPWDREQTARTIVPHTVEEAYEVADAALAGDDEKLHDELGDLLFQTYFLALLLDERGKGSLEDVARLVHEKLVRRHPHVFGEVQADTAERVRSNWERIKVEQEGRQGIFHDVPDGLPALLRARKVQKRAAHVGFEYPDVLGAFGDLREEIGELGEELERTHGAGAAAGATPRPRETEPDRRVFDELGDLLLATVNVARMLDVDPELALRASTDRFRSRVERAEALAAADGEDFSSLTLTAQDRYFDQAKTEED